MQLPFFPEADASTMEILPLGDDELLYFPHFLSPSDADEALETLRDGTPWQQDFLNFGGRRVAIPRLQAWYGDKHSDYGYSGLALTPLPWTPGLAGLKSRIENLTGEVFNSVLLNFYRHGSDSVSWHSDDEPELGNDPVIASLSLGVTRRFEMKHRAKLFPKAICELGHGSLLVMGHGIQNHWQHQVPKQPAITEPRINLTFRHIVG